MSDKKIFSQGELDYRVQAYKNTIDTLSTALDDAKGRGLTLKKQLEDRRHEFEKECRKISLQIARDMRPSPVYNGNFGQNQPIQPHYDLLKEAEAIYRWLIKAE